MRGFDPSSACDLLGVLDLLSVFDPSRVFDLSSVFGLLSVFDPSEELGDALLYSDVRRETV